MSDLTDFIFFKIGFSRWYLVSPRSEWNEDGCTLYVQSLSFLERSSDTLSLRRRERQAGSTVSARGRCPLLDVRRSFAPENSYSSRYEPTNGTTPPIDARWQSHDAPLSGWRERERDWGVLHPTVDLNCPESWSGYPRTPYQLLP
jgi:hypothetical protein